MKQMRLGSLVAGMIFTAILLTAGLTACGSDEAAPTPTITPPPTATIDPNSPTPPPTATPLPPTWTPAATLTEPPRVTIDYDYQRPTEPPLILPTYTPSPVPPSPTPPGPVLMITADMLTNALAADLQEGVGGLFDAPPNIGFQEGVMLVSLNVLTTPGDMASARPVRIRANVVPGQGRVEVRLVEANFTDNNAIYDDELVTNLLDSIASLTNAMITELYQANTPDGPAFFVAQVLIADLGLTIQTATIG